MPGTPTTKYAIPTLAGSDLARDIDTAVNSALTAIDSKMTGYSEGPFASRPVSTGGSPGVAGREYRATDLTPPTRYRDTGTGWEEIPAVLKASTIWDPPSLANGATTSTTVTVTGAAIGDFALASLAGLVDGLILTATVPITGNAVRVMLTNLTGATLDVGSSALNVAVIPA